MRDLWLLPFWRAHLLSDTSWLHLWSLIDYLSLLTDFQSLHEAYSSLENGKVEGIMEEMFTAIQFIKRKNNSELSIAQVFEDKHGYGAAIKKDGFSDDVLCCLSKVTEFVSDDIYSNASAYLKSLRVTICFFLQSFSTRKEKHFSPQILRGHFSLAFFRITLDRSLISTCH